jgi:DNA helicase-2/ATP-dependent DNA helicase PcrA
MNTEQNSAASNLGAPTLVIAGPGTGKTTTLVGRYEFLLNQGVSPHRIICCTFSRKAADEIKERLSKEGEKPANISTFHALAISILKKIGDPIGIPKDFVVWSHEGERRRKVRELVKAHNDQAFVSALSKEEVDAVKILEFIDSQREDLLDPEDASLKAASRNNKLEVFYSDIYSGFDAYLSQEQKLDFPRMVEKAVAALEHDTANGGSYAKFLSHILIDEYQDINFSQKIMIDLMMSEGAELWAVGDDLQAIYGWRGSNVRYILDFEKNYPSAKIFTLKSNYRSGDHILQAADNLSRHFLNKYPKTLIGERNVQGEVFYEQSNSFQAEAKSVAKEISDQVKAGKQPSEIAVLSRTNERPKLLATELIKMGIPVNLQGGVATFSDYESKQFIAAATLIAGQKPGSRLPRVAKDVYGFCMRLKEDGKPWQTQIKALTTYFVKRPPANYTSQQVELRSKNIEAVSEYLGKFKEPETTLKILNATLDNNTKDAVFIGTIHSAKGLEWPSVFVLGWEDGHLPQRQDNSVDTYEEERRIAYVAITRAKDFLLLTSSNDGKSDRSSSPFLAEMLGSTSSEQQEPKKTTSTEKADPNLDRIKALLKKYMDPASTKAEKEAAIARAKKLMAEHGYVISNGKIVKVKQSSPESTPEIDRQQVNIKQQNKTDDEELRKKRWEDYQERIIAQSIAKEAEYTAHDLASGEGTSGDWGTSSALPGFLLDAGYSVRKDGPSQMRRHQILEGILLGRFEPPEYLTESVNLSWGKPNSVERLQKMRNSLNTSLGMQLGKSNPSQQAINKWVKDIEYLDTELKSKLN